MLDSVHEKKWLLLLLLLLLLQLLCGLRWGWMPTLQEKRRLLLLLLRHGHV